MTWEAWVIVVSLAHFSLYAVVAWHLNRKTTR